MKTLVVCSGGLDSVSMALMAFDRKDDVTLLTFQYGQKAKKETNVVKWLSNKYKCNYIKADISSLSWIFGKQNQLTNSNVEVEKTYKPSIVVPLRNGVFLELAMAYAYSENFDRIFLGSHLNDCELNSNGEYSFPDCTPRFFDQMMKCGLYGTCGKPNITSEDLKNNRVKCVNVIAASTLGFHKDELIRMAYKLDKEALFKTWSCYKNEYRQCGTCDSCANRKKAFARLGIIDETKYLA